jgi:membrane protein DedA with SNARE-associated domain/rhodanese-related sulfurtransferase
VEPSALSSASPIGLAAVVLNVLLDQLGLPVPAIPTLIVAGAFAAQGKLSVVVLLAGGVAACLLGDATWYVAGRFYGNRVMKLLCRISLNPDSCVSQTQSRFERWGGNALVLAKFIPGLSIIAPPLAGATQMGAVRFLVLSTIGSALWIGAGLGAGMLLRPQIESLLPHLQDIGGTAVKVILIVLVLYIAFKWWERRRFFALLRMARMSVNELYKLVESGRAPIVVDVRSQTARTLEPRRIPGALHVSLENVEQHLKELPRNREIVLYCTCPNEASAARVAKLLINNGFRHVRPLQGGLDAWIAAGYEVETITSTQMSIVATKPPSVPPPGNNSVASKRRA